MITRQLLLNDRRLPLGAIRADDARQQVKARFIDKNQGSALCHGSPTNDAAYWLDRVTADGAIQASPIADIEADAD